MAARTHPAELERSVRDALAHLHDPAYLETHLVGDLRGKILRRRLIDTIDGLKPARGAPDGRAGRVHELLRLRYVDALPVEEVQRLLSIGRSEYYREHERAIAAVGASLRALPGDSPRPSVPAAAPTNLTVPLTRFVGREAEMAEIGRLLEDGRRLICLVGTGGVGKTRLALEAARAYSTRWPDGYWMIDLGSVAPTAGGDAAVAERVLAAVGATLHGREGALVALSRHLTSRRVLLLMDNCEHLVDDVARLVVELLSTCPSIEVLATSREPLGVPGEMVRRVGPLPVPPPNGSVALDDALRYAAVALFVDRAALDTRAGGAVSLDQTSAAAVVRICRRLDGLPLAIELAAARAALLGAGEVAERLEDVVRLAGSTRSGPSRHRTLRALVAWSHDLLSPPEQVLFRRLAVFASGFDAAAATAVAGFGTLAPAEVFGLLAALTERSLVVAEPGADGTRYRLLETIRVHAAERLAQSGEKDGVCRQHASYLADLNDRLTLPKGSLWSDYTWRRHAEDMRAALRWAVAAGDAGLALRVSRGVGYLSVSGAPAEALAHAEMALETPAESALASLRVWVLSEAAEAAFRAGDFVAARARAGEMRTLSHLLDPVGQALALEVTAYTALWSGDLESARRDLEARLALSATTGRRDPCIALGDIARTRGDLERARSWYDEADRHRNDDSWLLRGRGHLARRQGILDEAERFFHRSMSGYLAQGFRTGMVEVLCGLAGCALDRGDPTHAARLVGAVEAQIEAAGWALYPPDRAELEPVVAAARLALGASAFAAAHQSGGRLTLEEAVAEALGSKE